MRREPHLRRWGAVYVLIALFLGSWGAQFATTTWEVSQQAEQHGQAFAWVEVWASFLSTTFENWQSEWLQLILQAVVLLGMKHILFKADAEDMEVLHRDVMEIKRALGLPEEDPDEQHHPA